jgi:hypothetical protein
MLANFSNNSLYRNMQIIMQKGKYRKTYTHIIQLSLNELLMWGRSEARHRNGLQV